MNFGFVSGCDATHWSKASALHTLVLEFDDKTGGDNMGYTIIIS